LKEDKDGLEYLEVKGVPSRVNRGGNFGTVAQMGQVSRNSGNFNPRIKYGDQVPLGACDAKDRITRLDKEGLDAAIIYPSLDLTWETDTDDVDYSQAMCRAYNRWVTDWSADSGGRLIPVAHLSLGDPAAAAVELERAVKAGHKGGWVVQFTATRKPHGHNDHDVLFAKAQELDVPLGVHVSLEPQWCWHPARFAMHSRASCSTMQYGSLPIRPFNMLQRALSIAVRASANWSTKDGTSTLGTVAFSSIAGPSAVIVSCASTASSPSTVAG
jgi:hypothetical protein